MGIGAACCAAYCSATTATTTAAAPTATTTAATTCTRSRPTAITLLAGCACSASARRTTAATAAPASGRRLQHAVRHPLHVGHFKLIDQPLIKPFKFTPQRRRQVLEPQRMHGGVCRRCSDQLAQAGRKCLGTQQVQFRPHIGQALHCADQLVELGQRQLYHWHQLLQQARRFNRLRDIMVIDQAHRIEGSELALARLCCRRTRRRWCRHKDAASQQRRARGVGEPDIKGREQGARELRRPDRFVFLQPLPRRSYPVAISHFLALRFGYPQTRDSVVDAMLERSATRRCGITYTGLK